MVLPFLSNTMDAVRLTRTCRRLNWSVKPWIDRRQNAAVVTIQRAFRAYVRRIRTSMCELDNHIDHDVAYDIDWQLDDPVDRIGYKGQPISGRVTFAEFQKLVKGGHTFPCGICACHTAIPYWMYGPTYLDFDATGQAFNKNRWVGIYCRPCVFRYMALSTGRRSFSVGYIWNYSRKEIIASTRRIASDFALQLHGALGRVQSIHTEVVTDIDPWAV